jgi:class 3 adenylate cyclase
MKVTVLARTLPRTPRPKVGLDLRPISEMKKVLAELPADGLVYLDVTGLSEPERLRTLTAAVKLAGRCIGILDPAGKVKDVAALFHAGAVDYVGKGLGLKALTAKRLKSVSGFAARGTGTGPGASAGAVDNAAAETAGAGDGWAGVKEGREHSFAFLFIEVDDAEEMKKRYEPANLASAMETFRDFVARIVTPFGGRQWMWSRFGGLVLFPLREQETPALLCALRILLLRVFYDTEESPLPGMISFRMALSTGSTVYHANDTGKIVSDGINSIFHLGRRHAQPGQFLVSAEAAAMAPEPLRPYLVGAGTYEGRRIFRFLQPIAGAGGRE